MADPKSRGLDVVKLCRNKPLTDGQRSNITSLLKDGADLSVRYGPGNTSLHFAAEKGHIDVVKELLTKGADPSLVNDEGKLAADFARVTGNSDIVKLLEAAASKKKTSQPPPLQASGSLKVIEASTAAPESNLSAEESLPPSLPEAEPAAATQPQVLSPAEREAFENTITSTLSSPLSPGVQSIGDRSNGYCVIMNPDGSLYAGTFVNSLRHGRGVQRWSDGHVYCGQWRNDVKHGQGSYRFSTIIGERLEETCDRYEGEWNNGCMHGRGIYYHKSGDVYDGEFENNEMSGHGSYMAADGTKVEGTFSRGEFVGSSNA